MYIFIDDLQLHMIDAFKQYSKTVLVDILPCPYMTTMIQQYLYTMNQKETIQMRQLLVIFGRLETSVQDYNLCLCEFKERAVTMVDKEMYLYQMKQKINEIQLVYDEATKMFQFCLEQRLDALVELLANISYYCGKQLLQTKNIDFYYDQLLPLPEVTDMKAQVQFFKVQLL